MTRLLNEIFLDENKNYILSNDQYNTGLSDDIDSKALCDLAHHVKGWEMNVFQTKTHKYVRDPLSQLDTIYMDLAVTQDKGIDNHLLMSTKNSKTNQQLINFNNILGVNNRDNKKQKFNLSALLMGYYLFDFPLPEDDVYKIALLCIDGSYQGYFNKDFHDTSIMWLEEMDMTALIDILKKYGEKPFTKLHTDLKSKGDWILYNNRKGILQISPLLDYEKLFNGLGFPFVPFPDEPLMLVERYKNKDFFANGYIPSVTNSDIVTYAYTFADKGRYSIKF